MPSDSDTAATRFTLPNIMIGVGAVLILIGVIDLFQDGDWLALAAGALLAAAGATRRNKTVS
jgi:hypothetical protein